MTTDEQRGLFQLTGAWLGDDVFKRKLSEKERQIDSVIVLVWELTMLSDLMNVKTMLNMTGLTTNMADTLILIFLTPFTLSLGPHTASYSVFE